MKQKMRKSSYILYNAALLLLMATALTTACTSAHDEGTAAPSDKETLKGHDIQLMPYANDFAEQNGQRRAAPSGFSAYTPDKQTNMGVYMFKPEDWQNPSELLFRYVSRWSANFEAESNVNYLVYGYMPKLDGMTSSLTRTSAVATVSTLTINGIKAITPDGLYVITGVKNTDSGLKEGNFVWRWTDSSSETYYIHLLMDHLYAAVQFRMKIDEDYAKLRTIKLKTMTLSTTVESTEVTVTLTDNATGASPVTNVSYTTSGDYCESEIFNNEAGVALSTLTEQVINAGFAPGLSGNLTLVSTFDVYDSKGNLIRKNCSATNKLPDDMSAARGQRVVVNMTVQPTYLYVLSDPDLDNPTVQVN